MTFLVTVPDAGGRRFDLGRLDAAFGDRPFTTAQAAALGVPPARLSALTDAGSVTEVLRGICVRGPVPVDPESRAALAGAGLPPRAVLDRRTAAWVHGLDVRSIDERDVLLGVDCVVPVGSAPVHRAGVRCHHGRLAEPDVVVLGGRRCTTPARTTADLLRDLAPPMALAAADAMAHRRLARPVEMRAVLRRCRGERLVARARELADWIEPRTESFGESWLRLRILEAGFPRPRAQIPLYRGGRELYRIDLGWPERRLGIEYDGEEFHAGPERERADRLRRDDIRSSFGWTVLAVGRGEVLGHRLDLERGLGELLGLEPRLRRRLW